MNISKTTYAAIAAILCSVLIFIIFNTSIASKLVTGIAASYLTDAAQQSLYETHEQLQTLLDDPALSDAATNPEILRSALLATGAVGLSYRPQNTEGFYLNLQTGEAVVIPPAQSGNGIQTSDTKENPPSVQERELIQWLGKSPLPNTDASTGILHITPQVGNGHLFYLSAATDDRTLLLLYTPEDLLNALSRILPKADAAISIDKNVKYVSSGLAAEFAQMNISGEGITLQSLLTARIKNHGVVSKPLIDSEESDFTITLLVQEVNLTAMLMRDNRFLIAFIVLIATIVTIFIGYFFYTGRTKRAYKPNPAPTAEKLQRLIKEGEGDHIEFKSSLRFNLKTEKNDKAIELASLKGMTAFLNTGGGTLLVGINDEGEILGLSQDGFRNSDHILRHMSNLIAEHIGIRHINAISLHTVELSNKMILAVTCRRATDPVFLTHKNNESFYIRQGPGNRSLSLSEFWQYSDKFN